MTQQFQSPDEVQKQQHQTSAWANVDPLVLAKEVRQRAYGTSQISDNPQLIQPLEELVSRFEQACRATGIATSMGSQQGS